MTASFRFFSSWFAMKNRVPDKKVISLTGRIPFLKEITHGHDFDKYSIYHHIHIKTDCIQHA